MHGDIIRKIINKRGYSLRQLGRMTGICDVVIGKLLKEKPITIHNFFKILNSLDLTETERKEIIEIYFLEKWGENLTIKKTKDNIENKKD